MVGPRSLLLAILAVAVGALEEVDWRSAHPCVRPGRLYQARCRCPGLAAGGYRLEIAIAVDGREVHATRADDLSAADLARGYIFSWIPPRTLPRRDCRLRALVLTAAGDLVAGTDRRLVLWSEILADLAAVGDALDRCSEKAPLPRLWLEQAALQAVGPPTLGGCELVLERIRRLRAWLDGEEAAPAPVPGINTYAYRCAGDGSVQPWRLYLPDGPPRALALVLGSPEAVTKADWPALPAAWCRSADRAGVVLVEPYPAGDRYWRGMGPRRCWRVLRLAHGLLGDAGDLPRILLTRGTAMAGGLRLVGGNPGAFALGVYLDPASAPAPRLPPPPPAPAAGGFLRRLRSPWRARPQLRRLRHLVRVRPGREEGELVAGLRAGGSEPIPLTLTPDGPGFWPAVLAALDTARPEREEYRVWAPGRYGPFVVVELDDWLEAGLIRYDPADRRLSFTGIRDLRLHRWQGPPPRVDGADYLPPDGPAPPGVKALGRARGPVSCFYHRPFAVVYGTRRHLHAAQANRLLARRFVVDWARHAQGEPPAYDDGVDPDATCPRANLICCGDPRDHALLAAWDLDLPVTWTDEGIGIAGARYPEREVAGLALAWPHPADDGRLLVILDGEPVWRDAGEDGGLDGTVPPLYSVGDLWVRLRDGRSIHRVFDRNWE